MENSPDYDVVIIGGSYAGLSAALTLGRAIRRVLVLDSGRPCNRMTPHSHNFLTQDGRTPADIAAQARAQVLAYPTVQLVSETAVAAQGTDHDFTVTTDCGRTVRARKLLFATGVRDLLPARPGLAECWGISAIHCPYCHGYEYRDQPTGILLNGDAAFEQARLIRNWTARLTVFTGGESTIGPAHRQQLAALGVEVETSAVRELVHQRGYLTHLALADERRVPLAALYVRPAFEQHCPLPRALSCTHTEAGYLGVDEAQKTSVAGIYAAGDATTMMRSVSYAVAAGVKAGAFLNHELLGPA
ncbi:pyridine nucleotide-disulfide oxidoreductase (plasmid) [Hymenobacter psoromatis]|nr:pyridine nucleotide-disulfide oxidoreductase [Hymenobacter psoromatis]